MLRHTTLLVGLCLATSALAHDFWLQPAMFTAPVASAVPITILVGHGAARQRWAVSIDRVVRFDDVTAAGTQDRRSELHPDSGAQDALLSFTTPGTHIIVLETNHAFSELPSIRFNAYLTDEGLTPALDFRTRGQLTDAPGRETYSRRAKALIQVGPAGVAPKVTRPVGLTLEIVPLANPYTLKPTDDLPVQILFHGKPLSGALVKLTNLDFDQRPLAVQRSDARGQAVFKVPHQGKWLVNVIWTQPLKGNPNADFETIFSSLTFGFPVHPLTATTLPGRSSGSGG